MGYDAYLPNQAAFEAPFLEAGFFQEGPELHQWFEEGIRETSAARGLPGREERREAFWKALEERMARTREQAALRRAAEEEHPEECLAMRQKPLCGGTRQVAFQEGKINPVGDCPDELSLQGFARLSLHSTPHRRGLWGDELLDAEELRAGIALCHRKPGEGVDRPPLRSAGAVPIDFGQSYGV